MSDKNYKFNIPEEAYGQVVEGIDLQILSSDSVRLIEAYVKQEGELSEIQVKVLHLCELDLQAVIHNVNPSLKDYFMRLHLGVIDVIKKLGS